MFTQGIKTTIHTIKKCSIHNYRKNDCLASESVGVPFLNRMDGMR